MPSFRSMAGKMIMAATQEIFQQLEAGGLALFRWNWVPAIFSLPTMAVRAPP